MFQTSDYKKFLPNWFNNLYVASWAVVFMLMLSRIIFPNLQNNDNFDHFAQVLLIVPAIVLVWDFVIDVQHGLEMRKVFWPFRKSP